MNIEVMMATIINDGMDKNLDGKEKDIMEASTLKHAN